MATTTLVVDKNYPISFDTKNDSLRLFAILGITEVDVYLNLNVEYEEDDVVEGVELDGYRDDITGHITFFKGDKSTTIDNFERSNWMAKNDILELFEINLDKLMKEQNDDWQ